MSVPYVIEKEVGGQERVYDLYSRLLKDRIIFIRGAIDQNLADSVVAQLLFLDSTDNRDIHMYINSPGGEISAMYSIFDTMLYILSDVVTLGIGQCYSAASFLLAAGVKGKRLILPNCSVMLHELSGGYQGKAGDMRNHHRHIEVLYKQMAKHYVEMTGQKLSRIMNDMKRDFYLSSADAVKYGVVDKIQDKK